ncbi:MAG: hypothetical protein ACRDHE_16675 [Ktedonobacterales bacterium]
MLDGAAEWQTRVAAWIESALTWYRLAVSLDRGAQWEHADAPA